MDDSALQSTSDARSERWNAKWLPRPWTLRLQAKLLAMYGPRYASQFRDETVLAEWLQTWAAGLAGLSGDELSLGLARALEESPEFAPTLGAFREMCIRATDPAHKPVPLLRHARVLTEAGESALLQIRDILTR